MQVISHHKDDYILTIITKANSFGRLVPSHLWIAIGVTSSEGWKSPRALTIASKVPLCLSLSVHPSQHVVIRVSELLK